MIEFLCGFAGFLFSLGVFALGFYVGKKSTAAPPKAVADEEELERARLERQRLEEDQAAFRLLTGYSADIAYGVGKFSEEGSE